MRAPNIPAAQGGLAGVRSMGHAPYPGVGIDMEMTRGQGDRKLGAQG